MEIDSKNLRKSYTDKHIIRLVGEQTHRKVNTILFCVV
jgi:hypothetical protein